MPAKRRERQPSLSVEFRCEVCEEIPPKNEKDSNANWSVYPTVCPSDGGRVTGRVVEHASRGVPMTPEEVRALSDEALISMTATVTATRAAEGALCVGGMSWNGNYDNASWESVHCGKQADWTIRTENDRPPQARGGGRQRGVNVRSYCQRHLPKAHRYRGLALTHRRVCGKCNQPDAIAGWTEKYGNTCADCLTRAAQHQEEMNDAE